MIDDVHLIGCDKGGVDKVCYDKVWWDGVDKIRHCPV